MMKYILIGIFAFSVAVGGALYFIGSGERGDANEIDWRLLGEMDYIAKKAAPELAKFNKTRAKVPGFMVPLEDNQQMVTEFLLVPSPQACIHVPAPPPNQMVYVKMKKGVPAAQGPIWVYGDFTITDMNSQYGEASFEIKGDYIEPYK
ncbi:MAG: DUF3299 domain-containing protein [Pseudobdellovibrio sp.]